MTFVEEVKPKQKKTRWDNKQQEQVIIVPFKRAKVETDEQNEEKFGIFGNPKMFWKVYQLNKINIYHF